MTQQIHPCHCSNRGAHCPQKHQSKYYALTAITGEWSPHVRSLQHWFSFYLLSYTRDGLSALMPASTHMMKNHFQV